MQNYKITCPNCGSKFEFDPKIKALKCVSCGTVEEIEINKAKERSYNLYEQNTITNNWDNSVKTIKCNHCGAVEILQKHDYSETCPFCGNTNIIKLDDKDILSPSAILPFTIKKSEAKAAFVDKIKRNFWVPRKLKRSVKLKEPTGVYAPVYSFDALALCDYSGTLYRNETVYRTDLNNQLKAVEEEHPFEVSGKTALKVDDILIDAGQVINGVILKRLEPFDSNNSVEFDDRFLYGFSANQSKKSLTVAHNQAENEIKNLLKNKIVSIHNATRAGNLNINMHLKNDTYKYILLPVYTNGFSYNNKVYTLYCNGTTSKVAGKMPISKFKLFMAILMGIGAFVGVIIAILLSVV